MSPTPKKKKLHSVVYAPRHSKLGTGVSAGAETSTLIDELTRALRATGAFTVGDQVPPCAILWSDEARLWESVLPQLKSALPELYVLGKNNPAERTGPAIWLRCVEARAVEPALSKDATPIFYLPGFSRQSLREIEECPPDIQPLAELQFRGAVWSHPNGRDWSPLAFLSSDNVGLGLDVPSADRATLEALQRALPALLKEQVVNLFGETLDTAFLNALVVTDPPVEILRWMNEPGQARKNKSASEWQVFCEQCYADYQLRPAKDGELRAAELLAGRDGNWAKVWTRFAEAPKRYPGVAVLLDRAAPKSDEILPFDREVWPTFNAHDEATVAKALLALKDKPPADAAKIVLELEKKHGCRRLWLWREVGRAQLAVALEPLSRLANLTQKPLAGASSEAIAALYTQTGWEADAAALAALACGTAPEENDAITTAVRALYLQWADDSARNLQTLFKQTPASSKPLLEPVEAAAGRVILFVDGLRFDLAQKLVADLKAEGKTYDLRWDWSAFPSVTDTGKPYVSPLASFFTGGGPEEEFAPSIAASTQILNPDRFKKLLKENGIQFLEGQSTGDPSGKAWAEVGSIDSHGHSEGWRVSKAINQEMMDLNLRIHDLLIAGWREILVVTDHGWLLVPGGLPKVTLSAALTEHRWGRCAALKTVSATELPTLPWHWNTGVTIATPPGAGCFRAGIEYSHGGISPQEMIVPRMLIRLDAATSEMPKIDLVKWVGLRCRVSVQNCMPGLKVDLRGHQSDKDTSKTEGKQPREIGLDGTVSLPVSDDKEAGTAAVIVLLNSEGTILHAKPTVVGENV